MDILASLNDEEISRLRQSFFRKDGRLSQEDFVGQLMKAFNTSKDLDHVTSLCSLFNSIDINSKGTVSWDDFTTFCVVSGISKTAKRSQPTPYVYIQKKGYSDKNSHGMATHMQFYPELNCIFTCEASSSFVKIYNSKLKLLQKINVAEHELKDESAIIRNRSVKLDPTFADSQLVVRNVAALCTEYIPTHRIVAISSNELLLQLWTMKFPEYPR